MIRSRDLIRLSVQKLGLRKKRAVFSIISVALGVVVVVTINSLIQNVRDLVMKTNMTEELDRDVIKIYAGQNPYEFGLSEEERREQQNKRSQFLTESTFETLRNWADVEAADHSVTVYPASVNEFGNRPRSTAQMAGVSEAMLKRYVTDARLSADVTNAIPLVVGERCVRLQYDARKKNFTLNDSSTVNDWIGREVVINVGDNYSGLERFSYDRQKKQWNEDSQEDIAQRREAIQRNLRAQYDTAIMENTLALRGRIVGLCPGNQVLIPLETADSCARWITQRRLLASWQPPRSPQEVQYSTRGQRAAKSGEYSDGIVLVKRGVDTENVARRIRTLGFQATTRASVFEAFVKELDTGIRVIKRVAYSIGGVILGIAFGLLWSTTSRIVSDSRADIGLFRALGATKRDIRRFFLSEAALLGLLGAAAGIVLGWTLAFYISRFMLRVVRSEISDPEELVRLPDSVFSVDIKFCLLLLIAVGIVAVLAGLIPATRAARIDPVKALKRE